MDDALRVREFWFGRWLTGPLPGAGELAGAAMDLADRSEVWFETRSPQMQQHDAAVRTAFAPLLERAARGELAGWAASPRRRLSLIILLDQFPRQIHRGTPRAFAYDEQALGLTLSGMQCAADGALNVVERIFFYMPLQHAESVEVQDESVAAYTRLADESPAELRATFTDALHSARTHQELIARFGRFPHRNQSLGRTNTAEESEYLAQDVEKFGQ